MPDFQATERLIHDIERRERESRDRIVEILRESGREDLIAEFQQRLQDVDTGVYHARSLWHSITNVQRMALLAMIIHPVPRLVRSVRSTYDLDGPGVPLDRPVRIVTLRNLAARGLVDWDGGAFDPEAAAVLSEQGRFVLSKGRPQS